MSHKSTKWEKKPLYRKVNTRARNVHHNHGDSYAKTKGKKNKDKESRMVHEKRGLDYTPLFIFLLKNVGKEWKHVFSEAKSRLDTEDPIHYMVKKDNNGCGYFGCSESSYYSTLYVDNDDILQYVDSNINETSLKPFCKCCTHTFNGKKFTKQYFYEG